MLMLRTAKSEYERRLSSDVQWNRVGCPLTECRVSRCKLTKATRVVTKTKGQVLAQDAKSTRSGRLLTSVSPYVPTVVSRESVGRCFQHNCIESGFFIRESAEEARRGGTGCRPVGSGLSFVIDCGKWLRTPTGGYGRREVVVDADQKAKSVNEGNTASC